MDVRTYIDGLLARAEQSPLFGDEAFPGLYPVYRDLQLLPPSSARSKRGNRR